MIQPRLDLADKFTIDTMSKFGVLELSDTIAKGSELYKYIGMYNTLFTNTIRNWYEMGMDHPLFKLYKIVKEESTADDYCMSSDEFRVIIEECINDVNNLIKETQWKWKACT